MITLLTKVVCLDEIGEREIKGPANPTKHSDGVLPPSITATVVDDNISLSLLHTFIDVSNGVGHNILIIIILRTKK